MGGKNEWKIGAKNKKAGIKREKNRIMAGKNKKDEWKGIRIE